MKNYQSCFINDRERLIALRRLGDPLMKLSKHIGFEMIRPYLEEALRKEDIKAQLDNPLDVVFMFRPFFLSGL